MKIKYIILSIIILAGFIIIGGLYIDKTETPDQKKLTNSPEIPTNNSVTAPEFAGIESWLNLDKGENSLTMEQLPGKVVLVDFWTYSCINCIRTLPYVTGWYEKYKDQGLVVVGVHTPEFPFEKDKKNVERAVRQYDITYPVAQDNGYKTWQAYRNHYWPAHYLVDQNGKIVYTHFGEGKYQETEKAIQKLLGAQEEVMIPELNKTRIIRTPEIYFGIKRLEFIEKEQIPSSSAQEFSLPSLLTPDHFALDGQWAFDGDYATMQSQKGKIKLDFYAKDVHMVAESKLGTTIKVYIDGTYVKTVAVGESKLYTLYEGDDSRQRTLELEVDGSEFKAYTFTFG